MKIDYLKIDYLKLTLLILGVLVLVLSITSFIFYKKFKDLAVNPQRITQEENQKTINAVGKLVLLPEGESPTVATVTDPEKLKSEQAFFAKAKQGDKVLIYTQALRAIMYRPSENKIIEISPLIIGNQNISAN